MFLEKRTGEDNRTNLPPSHTMQSVFNLSGHVYFEPVTRRAKSVPMKREPTSCTRAFFHVCIAG